MKVLVFEPARGGHHLGFLRFFVEDLLAGGHAVHLAAETGATPSAPLAAALGPLLARCTWVPLDHGPGRVLHGARLDALARAQRRVGAERVFACCLDLFTSGLFRRQALGLPAPRVLHGRITGLFVRPRVADRREIASQGRWKTAGFRRLHRSGWLGRFFVLDESLPGELAEGVSPGSAVPLPDPWTGDFSAGRAEARRALGLPENTFLFLHYGTSSPRKGLPVVVAATRRLGPEGGSALVAAGRILDRDGGAGAGLRELAAAGCAYLHDRYIVDAEEPLFFRACDAVVLAYQGHYGSSNVQSRAAAAGRPVVTSDEGLVGWRTRHHGLGLTFRSGDAGELAAALARLRQEGTDRYAPALRAYAARHSRESFRQILLDHL